LAYNERKGETNISPIYMVTNQYNFDLTGVNPLSKKETAESKSFENKKYTKGSIIA
jgi:hypothetical protein